MLAAYAQGDYRFVRGLKLTAGVRHDQYNDFGGTTNPRVALVYNYQDKVWAKALFATAFRAPTYRELWSQNNPNNPWRHPVREQGNSRRSRRRGGGQIASSSGLGARRQLHVCLR